MNFDLEIIFRFEKRVKKVFGDGCWEWLGGKRRKGYGAYRGYIASRFAWMIWCGEIPEGLDVLHKCDNPGCVRPNHLFLGTDKDNHEDAISKGRMKTHRELGRDGGLQTKKRGSKYFSKISGMRKRFGGGRPWKKEKEEQRILEALDD